MNNLFSIVRKPKYLAPLFVFASINILMGTWVLYIPFIKEKLGLDDGQIGVALFSFAAGALVSIPFAPKIINYFGTGKTTALGILFFITLFILPITATTYFQLCLFLHLIGIFSSVTNIAMNALVAEIEKRNEINFMTTAHGFFSLGGVIGAGLGALLIDFINVPLYHFLIIVIAVNTVNLLFIKQYFNIKTHIKEEKTKFSISKYKSLLLLAFLGIIISGNEGAIENWSSLFLKERVNVASDNLTGLGFLFFSFFMMFGRFFGDQISAKIGSFKIMFFGFFIAVGGHLLVLTQYFPTSIIGFSLLGIGLSVIFPEIIRLASKSNTHSPPVAISFVSGIGFLGFLGAPILMGYISKISNLSYSFGTLTFACIVGTLLILKLKNSYNS